VAQHTTTVAIGTAVLAAQHAAVLGCNKIAARKKQHGPIPLRLGTHMEVAIKIFWRYQVSIVNIKNMNDVFPRPSVIMLASPAR
jgi:hypothetical protein